MAVPCEMLLHPELLTNEQLISIIHERHLRVPNIDVMGRDDLLELFHQFCVPYGQRKYRDTGRGKILNKVRDTSPERIFKLNTMNNNILCCNSHRCDSNNKLRPPPDVLSGHVKRMRLNTNPTDNDGNIFKRKMSVDGDNTLETLPRKKERKLITWP